LVLAVSFLWLLITWRVNLAIRKQDVERLKEHDRQHSMLAATVGAQEQERVRIAKDLHDDIQVLLSAVKHKLSMMKMDLRKKGFENDLTTEPAALVQDAIESVRNISRDLMPVTLARLGLGVALQDLSEKIGTDNLKINFRVEGIEVRLEKELELAMFRVCQELFNNSLKHAAASEIQLALIFLATSVRIEYSDNGKGFLQDVPGKNSSGLGLRNIESRISLIGGEFSYTSAPGKGFHFELEVPVQPASEKL
jgi:signal transduction histidine kinase